MFRLFKQPEYQIKPSVQSWPHSLRDDFPSPFRVDGPLRSHETALKLEKQRALEFLSLSPKYGFDLSLCDSDLRKYCKIYHIEYTKRLCCIADRGYGTQATVEQAETLRRAYEEACFQNIRLRADYARKSIKRLMTGDTFEQDPVGTLLTIICLGPTLGWSEEAFIGPWIDELFIGFYDLDDIDAGVVIASLLLSGYHGLHSAVWDAWDD